MARKWLAHATLWSLLAWFALAPAQAARGVDGLLFLTRERNPHLTFFDAATEKTVGEIHLPGPPLHMLLLKQAKTLLVALHGEILLLELDTRQVVGRMPFSGPGKAAVASPDEIFVAVVDGQGAVHLARSKNLSPLPISPLRFDAVVDVYFDRHGALVVLTGGGTPAVVSVSPHTGAILRSAALPGRHAGPGHYVVFGGGSRFAALDDDGRSLIVADEDGHLVDVHRLAQPSDVLLPAPKHVLALASDRQSVTVIPVKAGKAPRAIDLPFAATSHTPVFGGLMTAFASREQRQLVLVDSQTLSLDGPVVDLPGRPEGMASVAIAPLNLYVLLADAGGIAVVNLLGSSVMRTIRRPAALLGIASPAHAGICH